MSASRFTLALAAAGIGAMIPGFLDVRAKDFVRAGGATAMFVIVFFFTPPPPSSSLTDIVVPADPADSPDATVRDWFALIDAEKSRPLGVARTGASPPLDRWILFATALINTKSVPGRIFRTSPAAKRVDCGANRAGRNPIVSITRRAFCAAAPSLLVLGGCGGGGDTDDQASAGPASSCAYSIGQGVNVDLSRFYQQAAQQQQAMMWCWAACIAMVFASKGYPISQARIVSTAYGGIVNLPAYGITIAQALNRDWIDDLGRPFRSALTGIYDYQGGVANLTNSGIVSSIRSGTPVIIGTGSHARVLVAVDFQPTAAEPNIIGGTVFDPFTARLQCLSYEELFVAPAGGSLIFMATVNVA